MQPQRDSFDVEMGRLSSGSFTWKEEGLTSAEAQERLVRFGPNSLPEKKQSTGRLLFKHFIHGPMQYLILISAIISASIMDWSDFVILVILLLANGYLGFFEAKKTKDALGAIQSSLAPIAKVYRDGILVEVPREVLVPGDKILLNIGAIVPADAEFRGAAPVTIDESALTGETVPVTKVRKDAVLSGTIVRSGQGPAYVTATGQNSVLGKSVTLVARTKKRGKFEKMLRIVLGMMVIVAFVFVAIIFGVNLGRGESFGDVIQLVVVIAVASIPVAMPLVIQSVLSAGARQLTKKGALVSRLSAIEEMAGMCVLCSDKTGTLTQNHLTIRGVEMMKQEWDREEVVGWAALAVDRNAPEAIDIALQEYTSTHNPEFLGHFVLGEFTPFDPVRKRADILVQDRAGVAWHVSKGAVSTLAELSNMTPERVHLLEDKVIELGLAGLRPLGIMRRHLKRSEFGISKVQTFEDLEQAGQKPGSLLFSTSPAVEGNVATGFRFPGRNHTAGQLDFVDRRSADMVRRSLETQRSFIRPYRAGGTITSMEDRRQLPTEDMEDADHEEEDYEWEFLGIITLEDPLRVDTADTIRRAQEMGVKVKMITGDHEAVARNVLRQLNMNGPVHGRAFFQEATMMSESLAVSKISEADGFAQVYPEHKYMVVEFLQKNNNTIGMTGDGVNDAPALKKADVGIAVQGATDAARAAADLVLTSPGLGVIVDALESSRKVFHRMSNYITFRIAASFQILVFTFVAVIFLRDYQSQDSFEMPAIILVLITLLSDGANITSAFDKVPSSSQPQFWKYGEILPVSLILGALGVVEIHQLYVWVTEGDFIFPSPKDLTSDKLKGIIFLGLSLSSFMTIFITRTKKFFFSRMPGLLLLVSVLIASMISIFLAVYWPFGSGLEAIGWRSAGLVIAFVLIAFVVKDMAKIVVYALLNFFPFEEE